MVDAGYSHGTIGVQMGYMFNTDTVQHGSRRGRGTYGVECMGGSQGTYRAQVGYRRSAIIVQTRCNAGHSVVHMVYRQDTYMVQVGYRWRIVGYTISGIQMLNTDMVQMGYIGYMHGTNRAHMWYTQGITWYKYK